MDDLYIVSIKDHKTGSMGSAKLVLDTNMMARIRTYMKYIRPALAETGNDIPNLFIMPGSHPVHFNNLLTFKYLDIDIPTATMVRKIGATTAIQKLDKPTNALVSRQMSHHPTVSANYYQGVKCPIHAATSHQAMEGHFMVWI